MRIFMTVLTVLILLVLWGCQGNVMTLKQAEDLLAEHSYEKIKLNMSQNFKHDERPWVCLCQSSDNGDEYIVMISPSNELTEIQLGTEERLTYDQMKEVLVREGIVKSVEDVDLDHLNPGITDDTPIHWYYQDLDQSMLYRFQLDGTRISRAEFSRK